MLGTPLVQLLLKCVWCEAVSDRLIERTQLSVIRGEFTPVRCDRCGEQAMVPTVRPWELSFNDRKLLRQLRVTVE